jgi:hypothetical protein
MRLSWEIKTNGEFRKSTQTLKVTLFRFGTWTRTETQQKISALEIGRMPILGRCRMALVLVGMLTAKTSVDR